MPISTPLETKTRVKAKKEKASKTGVFAVIATGGKQYKVAEGDRLKIEQMRGDFKEGDAITFDKVLLFDDGATTKVGVPHISGAKVEAKLIKISRYPKVTVIKYKQKSRYYKKAGHRQPYFEVKIESIK